MSCWDKITNPVTDRKVSIHGAIGKKIIKNYLYQLNLDSKENSGSKLSCDEKSYQSTSAAAVAAARSRARKNRGQKSGPPSRGFKINIKIIPTKSDWGGVLPNPPIFPQNSLRFTIDPDTMTIAELKKKVWDKLSNNINGKSYKNSKYGIRLAEEPNERNAWGEMAVPLGEGIDGENGLIANHEMLPIEDGKTYTLELY